MECVKFLFRTKLFWDSTNLATIFCFPILSILIPILGCNVFSIGILIILPIELSVSRK